MHGVLEIKIKEQQAPQFVLIRETEGYSPVFFRMCRSAHSDLDEIELKEKCIHPIETADFGALLYKWELSVYV